MRISNYLLNLTLIMAVFLLTACSSNSSLKQRDKTDTSNQGALAIKQALSARGFYLSPLGNINYIHPTQCGGFQLQSHRGSIRYPENSINAVLDSLDNGFDVIEVDVRVTSDGVWVLHHDSHTGRETGSVDNKRRRIDKMNFRNEWGYLRARDQHTGRLLSSPPPTYREVLKAFASMASQSQKLNIEIKSNTTREELELLDYLTFKILGNKRYFYSSLKRRELEKMRKINSRVFLSYIQRPAKDSFLKLKSKIEKGAKSDNIYKNNRELIERISGFGDRHYIDKRIDNRRGIQQLQTTLVDNYGIAIDIRHYAPDANRIKALSDSFNIPVATYTINGHRFHAKNLQRIKENVRPDSVIIDDTLYGFCTDYDLPKLKQYQGSSELTRMIAELPYDLDLERLSEVPTYYGNGLYPSIQGSIKSIYGATTRHNYKTIILNTHADPKEREAQVELKTDKAIEIEFRKSNK
ncbi:glycerophosphodiester phosphodiesterase [Pseudoalteromonas citrea]|nr:glycerophosphodiester phosphodiesterase [Pseudoalteromonas citrea]